MVDGVVTSKELDALLGVHERHSLVYKGHEYFPTFQIPKQCPRTVGKPWMLDYETGETYPPTCRANFCPRCVRSNRWKTFRAVGASGPTAMISFSLVGDEWELIQKRMTLLRTRLCKQGYMFEWAWKVECSDSYEAGVWRHTHHVHAYVHGAAIPDQGTFGEAALLQGFGMQTDLLELTHSREQAAKYLWAWEATTKTKRGTKTIREINTIYLIHHLSINGGRPVHASHGFWRFRGERMTKKAVLKALNAKDGDGRVRTPN